MSTAADEVISVQRRIAAPASAIFAVLSDPATHPDIDGSGMLRAGVPATPITAIGDVFTMNMFFPDMGDYQMDNHVVEYAPDRRIAWNPVMHGADPAADDPMRNGSRWGFTLAPDGADATMVTETYDCSHSPESVRQAVNNGQNWVEGMTKSLENLEGLCVKG